MSKKSMEDAWDGTDKGAAYPGNFIHGRWRIACERHLDDLRHETGALKYASVRSTHYDQVALRPNWPRVDVV